MNKQYEYLKKENKNNIFINESDIKEILVKYGLDININNIDIYRQAFIHKSYLKPTVEYKTRDKNVIPLQDNCNERLEILGDSIVGSTVVSYLYKRFPTEPEGFITKNKTKIVRGKTLGKLGKRMGFGKWVIISQHIDSENGRNRVDILEDLFECFIGAIYLDNDGNEPISKNWSKLLTELKILESETELDIDIDIELDIDKLLKSYKLLKKKCSIMKQLISERSNGFLLCQRFILNILEKEIDLVKLLNTDDNYKAQIQQEFLKYNMGFPEWKLINIEGPVNDRWHTIAIHDDKGNLIGIGKARKKNDAEQLASKNALKSFGINIVDSDNDELADKSDDDDDDD